MKKKTYMQFSKKIVVAVLVAVSVLSLAGMIFAFIIGDADECTAVIRLYIQYAMVVFAAYSGNSAVEKWLVHRGPGTSDGEQDTDDDVQG